MPLPSKLFFKKYFILTPVENDRERRVEHKEKWFVWLVTEELCLWVQPRIIFIVHSLLSQLVTRDQSLTPDINNTSASTHYQQLILDVGSLLPFCNCNQLQGDFLFYRVLAKTLAFLYFIVLFFYLLNFFAIAISYMVIFLVLAKTKKKGIFVFFSSYPPLASSHWAILWSISILLTLIIM